MFSSGSVESAIATAAAREGILLVLVVDPQGAEDQELEQWLKSDVSELYASYNVVGVRLEEGSAEAAQFKQLYPVFGTPMVYYLNPVGAVLNCFAGKQSVESLQAAVKFAADRKSFLASQPMPSRSAEAGRAAVSSMPEGSSSREEAVCSTESDNSERDSRPSALATVVPSELSRPGAARSADCSLGTSSPSGDCNSAATPEAVVPEEKEVAIVKPLLVGSCATSSSSSSSAPASLQPCALKSSDLRDVPLKSSDLPPGPPVELAAGPTPVVVPTAASTVPCHAHQEQPQKGDTRLKVKLLSGQHVVLSLPVEATLQDVRGMLACHQSARGFSFAVPFPFRSLRADEERGSSLLELGLGSSSTLLC
eukprot:RCo035012